MTPRRSSPRLTNKKTARPASKRTVRPAPVVRAPKRGQRCPQCGEGKLDYDGFLNLVCPLCGYSGAGGGCT